MWKSNEIAVEIEAAEGRVAIVRIAVPAGVIELIGAVSQVGRVLRIEGAHVQGLIPGALGRAGLNAIGRKLMEEADVEEIVIEGGARTTGRRRGLVPRVIRFPRRPARADPG